MLLGSFLVPVTAVVWYVDHDPSPELSPLRVISAFIVAGVLGVLGASVLEYYLIRVGLLGTLEDRAAGSGFGPAGPALHAQ